MNLKPEDIKVGMLLYFSDDHEHWYNPKNRWMCILSFEVTRLYLDRQGFNTVFPEMRVCFREVTRPRGLCGEVKMYLSDVNKFMTKAPSLRRLEFQGLELLLEHEREVMEYLIGEEK